jgi:hypothetical protein
MNRLLFAFTPYLFHIRHKACILYAFKLENLNDTLRI